MEYPVTQSNETPVEVIRDGRGVRSTSYMWVHQSGEMYRERPVVLYEYQKTQNSSHSKEFYKDYKGILVTDGLEQYHKIERELLGPRQVRLRGRGKSPWKKQSRSSASVGSVPGAGKDQHDL